jgi:hypothetical protein
MSVCKNVLAITLGTFFLWLLPAAAHGDPIRVTSGFATAYSPSEPSGSSLRNDSGFFISGDGFGSLGFPGGQIGDAATLNGDFYFGFGGPHGARVDGTTYSPFLLGGLDFTTTPFVLSAPDANGTGHFQTAFTMTGRVTGYSDRNRTPASLLFDVAVFGSGSVNGFAVHRPGLGYLPLWASASYSFAPAEVSATPEPASMLLLGTGLVGLIARKRSSSRRFVVPV